MMRNKIIVSGLQKKGKVITDTTERMIK